MIYGIIFMIVLSATCIYLHGEFKKINQLIKDQKIKELERTMDSEDFRDHISESMYYKK